MQARQPHPPATPDFVALDHCPSLPSTPPPLPRTTFECNMSPSDCTEVKVELGVHCLYACAGAMTMLPEEGARRQLLAMPSYCHVKPWEQHGALP